MDVNGVHQLFGDSLQNIFFCVQQKKTHTALEQLEGEKIMTEFTCSLNYHFNCTNKVKY